jgi:alpha-tubulin suppressor-like RCC1 family protein
VKGCTVVSSDRKGGLRWVADFLVAATLAVLVTVVSTTPLQTQAASPTGSPGIAWAWGSNNNGQLGNGSTMSSSTPVVVNLPAGTSATALAGGSLHSLALTSTGNVLTWGDNTYGSLGNGTTTSSSTPVAVSLPVGTTASAIAGGYSDSLALTSTGQVLAWGYNNDGQLGNGTTTNSSTPVLAGLPAATSATAIAAGQYHSLALTSAGRVLAWGRNSSGQLGTGTTTNSSTPVSVIGLGVTTIITAIAAGYGHSLALTSTGQVLAWGDNTSGQLGNGTATSSSIPVGVILPAGTTVTAIACGQNHSLALTSSGQVLTWGYNYSGQLGNGTTTNSSTPAVITISSGPLAPPAIAIAGGGNHSLARLATRQVAAWGSNSNGQLGIGTIADSSIPVEVTAARATVAIAAGTVHSLAIQEFPTVAVFPAMTNGAYGGYVTAATIKNAGPSPATIRIVYFNQNGLSVGVGDAINYLPVNASWTVRQDNGNSFPSSGGNAVQAGSAIVYSSQPIASFVNEFAPGNVGDATSYSGVQFPSGVGITLYAPTIVNNAYGGYTTGMGLLNLGSSPTDVTVTYRAADGAVIKTQTVTALASHAYQALYSGDATLALPNGFAGTATMTSTASQPLGAVVNETGPGGQFSSYDAVAFTGMLLTAPVALNNAYGGYFTGMAIQNTSATAGTVSVTYYDAAGTATAKSFNIAALGYLGVYQGSATDGPAPGAYTAVIQSTLPLAAIVNEVAPPGAGPARQSTSYNTFTYGGSTLHLALVENSGSDPWNTGLGIMNTDATAGTTVTVRYYDAVTGAPIGTPQTAVLAPHAFWGIYQPTAGLPSGSRATAVVTSTSGVQMQVICNESSPTSFMSYNAQ